MKISTRFAAAAIVCATTASLIGAVLTATTIRVAEELKQNRAAAEIQTAVAGLRYLTLEYALQPEARVQQQWLARSAALGDMLSASNGFDTDEERASLLKLRESHNEIALDFMQLIEVQRARRVGDGQREILDELVRRVASSVVNRATTMIAGAIHLQEFSREKVNRTQLNAIYRVIALSAGLALVVAAMMFFTFRSITRPLARLREGTALIAAGSLDHVIGLTTDDEIGDLARDFDQMTGKLRETTVSRDILAAEVAERQRAQDLNKQLAEIVESSDEAIISKSLDHTIISWNRGAEKVFGYTAHEAVGHSILMLFPPDFADEAPKLLARISRGESVGHFETVRLRKDGERIDVSVTLSPIRSGQGEVVGVSAIARDVSDRKQAEKKLRAQLARLDLLGQITRAISERLDLRGIFQVAICSIEDELPADFSCICLYEKPANELVVSGVGIRSEALAMALALGEQSRIPIDENGLSRCVRGQLVYEPDVSASDFPFPQRLARAGLRSLVAAPLVVESQVFGVLITARRKASEFSSAECEFLRQLSEHVALAAHQAQLHGALQQAYDGLRQTQQVVMQQERLRSLVHMASGIAHDINNAISPVALYTESLLETEPELSERARRYLQTIQRAIDDVARTVTRMREFYREREPQLTAVPVRLNPLVQQVLDLTRARWYDIPQQHGFAIRVQTKLATDLPAVMGIESELREALINLVVNAVDALPKGGTITLTTRADERVVAGTKGSDVRVEIADSGIGMSEETRQHCLEPFYTTKGDRGTGLGLAMVYGTVQRHGGVIDIASESGKGTTVSMVFPVTATDAETGATLVPSSAATRRMRILVVDDDPLVLRSLIDLLERDGHVVASANHGQAGIDTFRAAQNGSAPFEAVITDLGMPQIDGRMVSAAIKQLSPATWVILLTGWGQRMVADGDMPPFVDVVLSKPPKRRDLREALAAARFPDS